MLKGSIVALALLITPIFIVPAAVSAVDVLGGGVCEPAGQGKPGTKQSPVCKDKNPDDVGDANFKGNPFIGPGGILTSIVSLLTVIVGIVAIIAIILAGLKFITSGSNPQDVSNARERVIYAVIALIIAALAQVFVRFIIGRTQ